MAQTPDPTHPPRLPPRLLAFDSSTERLSIGVTVDGQTLLRELDGGAQASASLIAQALQLLAEAGTTLAQLDAIVFGRGPGAFTGLRTACAVAQGLALGAKLPVLPIDTLLAVAEQARWQTQLHTPATVLAVLDARMGEVYSCAYHWHGQHWSALGTAQVGPPEHLPLPAQPLALLASNALTTYGPQLPLPELPRISAWPSAEALLRLAPPLLQAGHALPAHLAMPLYVRDKVAQTTAERQAQKTQDAAASR